MECPADNLPMDQSQPDEPFARRSSWIADTPPEGARAALHRLAAAMRQISDALADMDAPEADLLDAAIATEQIYQELEAARTGHQSRGFAESAVSGDTGALVDRSPLLGLGNPIAPPLHLHVDGETVVGAATFGRQYEGPPGNVHGGMIAAAFDEALGMVQAMTGQPGMTGTLTIRYRQPTPLYREVTFRAWVESVSGRKIHARGTLHAGDTLCAEADGIFIVVDFERFREALSERGRPRPT